MQANNIRKVFFVGITFVATISNFPNKPSFQKNPKQIKHILYLGNSSNVIKMNADIKKEIKLSLRT